LFYADGVNILGGSVHTIKKISAVLIFAIKEVELEVYADNTKYMVMSRDKDAGRSHSMKIDNDICESVKEFKYLGTILTNQNSSKNNIRCKLKSGNACHYSVQDILSFILFSKHLEIKIYRAIILPVFVWFCNLVAHIDRGT
jgi:hypothetical protein